MFEVKWTRRSMAGAMREATKSWSWMRTACNSGRWAASRSQVKAVAVGALVVTPDAWSLKISSRGALENANYHFCYIMIVSCELLFLFFCIRNLQLSLERLRRSKSEKGHQPVQDRS